MVDVTHVLNMVSVLEQTIERKQRHNTARLQNVVNLLEKTIERKRCYAKALRDGSQATMNESIANHATAAYIDVNIAELTLIVKDLRSCL